MKIKRIWTSTARKLLFEELVERFGPHSEWEKATAPGRGMDQEFEKFCELMAELVGANSADAVKHQIAFGSPVTGVAVWNGPGFVQSAILNLAASFEAGFIVNSELPDLIAKRPKHKRTHRLRVVNG